VRQKNDALLRTGFAFERVVFVSSLLSFEGARCSMVVVFFDFFFFDDE
jgi:hypothetical protein